MIRSKLITLITAGALLAGCGNSGGSSSPLPQTGGSGGVGGTAPMTVDTAFTASGRYVNLTTVEVTDSASAKRAAQANGQHFFAKGIVYSPTPIGATPIDSPLKNSNSAMWMRDLPLMRAMGVNAIHVYNVTPPPYDATVGDITDFLKAAWNNGDHPIYVLMTIYFTGDALNNVDAAKALATQYHDLDAKYASYPAVMGVSVGNEIGSLAYINDASWWTNFNLIAKAAKQGFTDGGNPNKLVMTSEVDGNIAFVQKAEANGAPLDAYGVNIYRGRTFTNLFDQIRQFTKKPVMLTEWGASASYHPGTGDRYSYGTGPNDLGVCTKGAGSTSISDVAELPATGNPNMVGLEDYIRNDETLLYNGWKADGVVSGGFYFEWTDEWWKANAGDPSTHFGNVAYNGAFPGCNEDQGWYGLNAVSKGGSLDTLTPRPTLKTLQDAWASEP